MGSLGERSQGMFGGGPLNPGAAIKYAERLHEHRTLDDLSQRDLRLLGVGDRGEARIRSGGRGPRRGAG